MSEAASKTGLTQESEGEPLAPLLKAMNDGNANAIKQQSEGLTNLMKAAAGGIDMGMVLVIGAVLAGGAAMQGKMGGGNNSKKKGSRNKMRGAGSGRRRRGRRSNFEDRMRRERAAYDYDDYYDDDDYDEEDEDDDRTMEIVQKVAGVIVRFLLFLSIANAIPLSFRELKEYLFPWKWKKAWKKIRLVLVFLVFQLIYCIATEPEILYNPLLILPNLFSCFISDVWFLVAVLVYLIGCVQYGSSRFCVLNLSFLKQLFDE
jgi:hypothetical protein